MGLREILVTLSHVQKKKKKAGPVTALINRMHWEWWSGISEAGLGTLATSAFALLQHNSHAVRSPSHMERGCGKRTEVLQLPSYLNSLPTASINGPPYELS